MHPFSVPRLGEIYLRTMTRFAMIRLFYLQGIADRSATPRVEVGAYFDLLKREDGGRAFLRIMRGFELTADKERFFREGLAARDYPAQVVWGDRDRALGEERRRAVQEALGVEEAVLLPAKHFLQEDQAPAVAERVAALTSAGDS